MEETLTAHQEALIEAEEIVQDTLSVSIDDSGDVLSHVIEAAIFKLSLTTEQKLDSFKAIQDICLEAYDHAVEKEAKSIGLRK